MENQHNLKCPECGAQMILRSSMKFPTRDGKPCMFYGCSRYPRCSGTHGAHPDGTPLGTPANKETKAWRHLAHEAFDPLWQTGMMSKKDAYKWLSDQLGVEEAHMADQDIEGCEAIIALCNQEFQKRLQAGEGDGYRKF